MRRRWPFVLTIQLRNVLLLPSLIYCIVIGLATTAMTLGSANSTDISCFSAVCVGSSAWSSSVLLALSSHVTSFLFQVVSVFKTSDLQFGFTPQISTAKFTFVLTETELFPKCVFFHSLLCIHPSSIASVSVLLLLMVFLLSFPMPMCQHYTALMDGIIG